MKKIIVLKLGTVCTDIATGLTGTLTHWVCDMGHRIEYLFQSEGINPDSGQPIDKIILELERLKTNDGDCLEELEVPVEILGSQVTDKASGFCGMAVGFVRHINGCFHVIVQPNGKIARTNSPIRKCEFDLRGCRGEKIYEMTVAEQVKSRLEEPSPDNSMPQEHIPRTSSGCVD